MDGPERGSTASPEGTTAVRTRPWRYAVGMLGTSIPITMVRGSAVLFYVDVLGLDVRAYAAVMTVYAVVDAIDNPVLAHLSDRTRTRFGRRRPWLLVGAPLLVAAFVGFFSASDSLAGLGLVIWFAVFAIAVEALDSLLNVNYGGLLPELFPRERERSAANGLRQGFQLVALVISLAVTPLLTTSVLGTAESATGFRTTALIYGAVALVAILLMATGVRENPRHSPPERPPLLPGLLAIVRTPAFWTVGLVGACYTIPMALVLSGVQLYVRYSLGLEVSAALPLQGAVIVVAAVGLVAWTQLVRRRGAVLAWRLAFAVLTLSFVGIYLAQDLPQAIAAGALLGLGWSGLLATHDLVVAKVLDADVARHGTYREALFLSAFGFFGRLNGAATGWALASLALLFGYVSGDDPGPDPGGAFRTYLAVYPFALTLLGTIGALLVRFRDPTPVR